jgi:hypothetical protein
VLGLKRVVSVSLGSSTRNKSSKFNFLGEEFLLERIGTDGDMNAFTKMFNDLDGKVDAMGIGGADLYLVAGTKKYTFKDIAKCISGVKKTPVVDGSGLKHTLERNTIEYLQGEGIIDFTQEKVLLVGAVDRYGMAQALDKVCPDVIYGDFYFGLGLPIPIRSYKRVEQLAKILLPIITRLPLKWFYPTGKQQEERKPKFPKLWADRTLICGDSLFILRYAPDMLEGKTIITQSMRSQNLEFLKQAGVKRIITTTPVVDGESFATNVMEAAIVAYLGKAVSEVTENDMNEVLTKIGWKPNVIELQENSAVTEVPQNVSTGVGSHP